MPWSSQGGGGGGGWQGGGDQGGPWGRGSGGGGPQPPDLEELLRKGQDRMRRIMPRGFGGGRGLILILILIVAVWLGSGFYRVQADEQGIELVFGKLVNTTEPGLRYNWPAPIGQVYRPKVTRINRVEIGFRSGVDAGRGVPVRQVDNERQMMTGDENIIDINFVVLWKIKDAGRFLFNVRAPAQTVKAAAESAMREVIGKTKAEYARAEGRSDVEQKSRTLLQNILNAYKAGIQIDQVQLQKVDPPEQVIDAFRDVQRARADAERARNEARSYANAIVPRAQGDAAQMILEAKAYQKQVVAGAEGDAQRFLAVYAQYKMAKDVTVKRIYLETMEKVLKGTNKVIIDRAAGGAQGVLPYLPLPELTKRKAGGTQ